ncbi:GNAT family N-acetyltransferase [Bordetella genomosp. 13]|uniref:GNAT family N-acetyltransferase n=1 Tax=Bordetella genomosp. 13 TaxID=463040 RepID=A0A1W6Z736_9BORD|nr:GNAT family N-acetyltransferase [Bordetella genomosp. 13]ARP93169.1 GNAT family N-acetyltransferase [Bordetella genomosp. 13]
MPDHHQTDEFLPLSVKLRDGRGVTIRPIRPDDRNEFAAAFERLSAEARYSRLFTAMRVLPENMLDSATNPNPDREVALVAVIAQEDRQIIVAGARYVYAADRGACEFAVTVAEDWHAQGLGRTMMELLIRTARKQRLRRMEGFVLSTNFSMRRLAERLGFADAQCPGDSTLRLVTLEL